MGTKRMGRPTKAPTSGERVPLGLRVTADTKRRLDAAAETSGRSQSQEAELRLEQSFTADDALGGPDMRAATYLMASRFNSAGRAMAHSKQISGDWIHDPGCYLRAMFAALGALIENAGDLGIPIDPQEFADHFESMKTGIVQKHLSSGGK
jgi:hypothetical protein